MRETFTRSPMAGESSAGMSMAAPWTETSTILPLRTPLSPGTVHHTGEGMENLGSLLLSVSDSLDIE